MAIVWPCPLAVDAYAAVGRDLGFPRPDCPSCAGRWCSGRRPGHPQNPAVAARVRQLAVQAEHRRAIAEFRARRAADQQARLNALLLEAIAALASLLGAPGPHPSPAAPPHVATGTCQNMNTECCRLMCKHHGRQKPGPRRHSVLPGNRTARRPVLTSPARQVDLVPANLSPRLVCRALCQGAALHYLDSRNGVKDFDVWSFYAQRADGLFPYRWRGTADYGPSKFGRYPGDPPSFTGRRVDLLRRSLEMPLGAQPAMVLSDYLSAARTASAKALAIPRSARR